MEVPSSTVVRDGLLGGTPPWAHRWTAQARIALIVVELAIGLMLLIGQAGTWPYIAAASSACMLLIIFSLSLVRGNDGTKRATACGCWGTDPSVDRVNLYVMRNAMLITAAVCAAALGGTQSTIDRLAAAIIGVIFGIGVMEMPGVVSQIREGARAG